MSKKYTRNEVETTGKRGTEQTLIILHDKVYNVASFLNEHPGGEEILLDHAGKDSSEDFDDVGHSKDAFDLMSKYLVGELVDSEKANKKPKEGWKTTYNKSTSLKKDEAIHPLVITGIIGAIAALLYYLYL
ncbi:cytochrome b5 [Nomia melanderi]|uniref:cytochrome b5 n=1 Tax=Nomia melanderi TaxID=2448451 RepID=UPI0013041D20|nr:cytochrome b5-like [Nomia melanderi]XP_031838000.1 cytochrome b5-like [Nomia melanderi]XP_031838001.1 cytochrome b5-like [Nomia melanderi]